MKKTHCLLIGVALLLPLLVLAQSKNEMPLSGSSAEAKKLLRQAWAAYNDIQFVDGNEYAKRALEMDPSLALAYVSIQPNSREEHRQNLNKALSLNISDDEKLFLQGLNAADDKKPVDVFYDPLIKKYPRDNSLLLWILYAYGEDAEKKIELAEKLIAQNPKFPAYHNYVGYLYMNADKLDKAEASFNKYIRMRPELANVYDSKADYFMRVGKIEEAIPLYEKAFSIDPKNMASSKTRAENARARLKYPAPSEKEKEDLKRIIKASADAYPKGDVDGLLRDYSEQAIEIFRNQMSNVGLANQRNRVTGMFKNGGFTKLNVDVEFVKGVGPIAFALGKTEQVFQPKSDEKPYESKGYAFFLFRKQNDGQWRVLADHWLDSDEELSKLSAEDVADVRKVLASWTGIQTSNKEISEKSIDEFAALYSQQAIEIFPSQRSNVGIANLRERWSWFVGARFESSTLGTIGVEGVGRKAIAWGIGRQALYPKGSEEITRSEFPWVMLLTKEKDDVWRILAIHWAEGS